MMAEKGEPDDQYNLAAYYESMGDQAEALKWYRKAADQGLPLAQFCVGVNYFNGDEVEQDSGWRR